MILRFCFARSCTLLHSARPDLVGHGQDGRKRKRRRVDRFSEGHHRSEPGVGGRRRCEVCQGTAACEKPKMSQNAPVVSIPFRFFIINERKTCASLSPSLPPCDMHNHSNSCQIVRPIAFAFASNILFLHHPRVPHSARERLGKTPGGGRGAPFLLYVYISV